VGGVNGAQLVAAGAPPVYDPEEVTAIEIGAKAQFMQRRLTVNTALYSNQYRNMHAQSFITACVDPNNPATCIASEFTANGGAVDAKGLEVEVSWRPDKRLFVNGSLALLDAKFGNYLVSRVDGLGNYEGRQDVTRTAAQIVAAGGVPALQLRGWRPALSPKVTATLHAGYQFATGGDTHLTPSIQLAHTGQYWSFDYNLPGSEQKAHTTVDLRMVWRHEKKGITITGFVENATNQQVLTRSVIFGAGEANVPTASIQANYNNPRTWGVKLAMDF
jgi:iron complex outermembrane recepter protein